MDLDQLHTFLEIVRLKSFSKAAQTCYRTQPAISAQIRQLEQELKAELFERFGSRISSARFLSNGLVKRVAAEARNSSSVRRSGGPSVT